MIRKLLPVLLALLGLGGGIGAGLFLRPTPEPADEASADHSEGGGAEHAAAPEDGAEGEAEEGGPEYVKMNNQFVVPVVEKGRVSAMVVLSLTLEVEAGNTENVYQREPKLRDAFLQVLFDHANIGGFSGTFTDGSNLVALRTGLKEAAAVVLGKTIRDVLITDIARQDS
jgi:flagellar protein FliL